MEEEEEGGVVLLDDIPTSFVAEKSGVVSVRLQKEG